MKKKLAILLVLTLILGLYPPAGAQAAENGIIRIGLAYNSTTMAAATLRNKTGMGYSFGYYDDQRQFVPSGWTAESSIAVLITQNQYLTGSGGYSGSSSGKGAVGCYHVQMPGSYPDFDSALAAASQIKDGFVAWIQGTYYVRAGSYPRRADAEAAAAAAGVEGAILGETSGFGYSAVADGTNRILFQFDANQAGETGAFGVLPAGREDAKAETVFNNGRSYYGGFRFERINGGSSTVVNMIDLEDYIKGVVPYEMSPSWPLEALKAQAVCARTYASGSARHSAYHFDLCTTTDCQAYKGTSGAGATSDQAVEETAGQQAYYNGRRIEAVYYSSNGGASEDCKNVWGTDHPYLKGKLDPYEIYATEDMNKSQLSYYQWTKTYTASSLKARLHEKGYLCEDIISFTTKESDVGNVIAFTVTDTTGKGYTFSRDKIRSILAINSIRFQVSVSGGTAQGSGYAVAGAATNVPTLDGLYALSGDGSVAALPQTSYVITQDGVRVLEPIVDTGSQSAGGETVYTLNGTGWGHNVGMSQWGAYAMAKQGYTYQDILKFYYTDITIQ